MRAWAPIGLTILGPSRSAPARSWVSLCVVVIAVPIADSLILGSDPTRSLPRALLPAAVGAALAAALVGVAILCTRTAVRMRLPPRAEGDRPGSGAAPPADTTVPR